MNIGQLPPVFVLSSLEMSPCSTLTDFNFSSGDLTEFQTPKMLPA